MERLVAASLALCLFASSACSSDDAAPESDVDGAAPILNGPGTGPDFMGAEEGASEDDADGSGSSSCAAPQPLDSCAGQTYAGEVVPLDIYIMFDQSGSMCSCVDTTVGQSCPNPACTQTRMDAVREATEQFLLDPKSVGIGVGLGKFGREPIGQASCNAGDFESPVIGVGALPAHATSIMQALNELEPTGETPTGAAIRGACSYAGGWKQDSAGHQVVMLLLTDGKPEAPVTCQGGSGACCPTLDDAVTAAEECRTSADIETYVLGVGPLLENLEQIAVAGGTEHAYLVEGGDVSAEVLQALNRIRGDIPCQLELPRPPNGETLDLDEVNLSHQSSECASTLFYSVPSAGDCGSEDGWYYDDPANPQSVKLCPTSCDRVSAPGGSLFYSVGCATQFRIR